MRNNAVSSVRHWLKSDFLRKVTALSINRGLVMMLGFLVSVVLVRELGPEGSGYYFTGLSLAMIGVQLGNMGLQVPHTLLVTQKREVLAGLTANILVTGLAIGGMEALLVAVFFMAFPAVAPVQGLLLGLSLAWIPFGIIYFHFYNLLIAIQEISGYVRIELITKVCQLLFMYLLAYYFDFRVEVFFALALVLMITSCYWQFLELRKHFRDRLLPSFGLYKDKFSQGLRVYLIGLLSLLLVRIDVLIVKYILGAEQTGYYSVAAKLADTIPLIPSMIAIILFPKLSALATQWERWKLVRKTLWAVILFLLPCMILAYFLAGPAIGLFYGPRFLSSVRSFQYLIPGVCFLAVHMLTVQFLKSEGFPLRVVINWLAVVSLNISLDLWLVPTYGIEAAAAVSSLCYFLIFLLNIKIVFKMMRHPFPKGI